MHWSSTTDLFGTAGDVSEEYGLRAGDAIQLAAAMTAGDLRLLTFDRTLLRAATDAGVDVV